ncbi:sigma 54-interacting transcriptional regulator [Deferrisoma camini]|uniref:sigma 54-interacting transcriptional regulator n=1 Tax=Deferrisoma camini TaxID=1035120 RepID=UPI00046D88B7|nr:sigma 54-interacting transcriptional regulator [Deferrisoma camini]
MSRPVSEQILVVDDDKDLLRLLSLRLRSAGFRVVTAESGEQALAVLATAQPDLVITDLRMEGMDGMGLYEAIRERRPSLPVIILTAHGSIPEAVEATRRGVFGFMTKPFDGKELLAEVRRALALAPGEGTTRDLRWRAGIVTRSPAMEEVLRRAHLAAQGDAAVLIWGESGTGKELLARAIHRASPRSKGPFVAINCGAIPEPLLESELFGHIRGAFTGATEERPGLFRSAQGGTLLLDEIGDMPLSLQVKLLRVLQDREIRPVGASRTVPVDVRVIAATHRNLEEAVREGRFREDLYYRIHVVRLEIPPLSERREDIPLLAEHFLARLAERSGRRVGGFAPDAMELLLQAPWPGNVRQLANVVEHAFTLTPGSLIPADLVREALREPGEAVPTLAEARRRFELEYLVRVLQMTGGNVTRAARIAGRNRTEFYRLLRRYHLDPSLFKSPPASM